jgi:hypothetical protein
MSWKLLAAFTVAVVGSTAALPAEVSLDRTQLPLPFGSPRMVPGQQCTPDYKKILQVQIDALKVLQRLTRKQGEQLCATLEDVDRGGVAKLIDPKVLEPLLTPQQREWLGVLGLDLSKVDVAKIMRMLGVDISQVDVRQLKDACRASQGELERFTSRELKRVEAETVRCDDRI